MAEQFTETELAESRAVTAPSAPVNPFGVARPLSSNAAGDTDQSRAIAETQAAMLVAKRFPRDQVAAMDRILNAFARPTLAEQGLYAYARGGSEITGLSIRAAEAMAQAWGNIQFGIRELEQRNGESTVEAFAWDIETNTRQVKVFQVPHVRYTKTRTYKLEDPRDVYEMVANQGARRLRACILGVIPGDVQEAASRQIEVTMATQEEVTPDKVAALLDAFNAMGVNKAAIEKRIQRHADAILPAQVVMLRKIYNSLKDGMSAPGDWFDIEAPAEGAAGSQAEPTKGAAALRAKAAQAKASKQAGKEPEQGAPDVDETTIVADLRKATNRDTLDAAATLIDALKDGEARDRCLKEYHNRLAELPEE